MYNVSSTVWSIRRRSFFAVCLAAHVSKGWKSLIRPSSGKDTAEDKGVHREVESEGSRMANLRSDE